MKSSASITAHIAAFPPKTRASLTELRILIRKSAPKAVETISYGIPTFTLNGKNLVHFAGYKTHIGFYPGPVAIVHFKKELAQYKTSRGTVQIPLDKPLPRRLIARMVKFRIEQETRRA
jgi:uncharacterized protein YdhG (YjbR/CyaY superfamily)